MPADEERPLTFWRAFRRAEFWLLLATAACGAYGVSGWIVVPLTTAGLSISSLPKYVRMWPRAQRVGAQAVWWRVVGLSTGLGVLTAYASMLVGYWLMRFWDWIA